MKLRYALRARNDIADIHEYIAKRNPRAATAVTRAIRATARLLARHPGLGRKTSHADVRVLGVTRYPYLVYHRVDNRELVIVHVRHGARATPTPEDL